MILGISDDDLTQLGHVVIIGGIIATYIRVELQKGKIERLEEGFDACKENLAKLEEMVKKK